MKQLSFTETKWISQLELRDLNCCTVEVRANAHDKNACISHIVSYHPDHGTHEGRLAIETWKAAGAWVPMCAKIGLLLADPQGAIHRQENVSTRLTDIGSPYFGGRGRPDDREGLHMEEVFAGR